MIFVPRKNIWTPGRNWGRRKFQRGIIIASPMGVEAVAAGDVTLSGESIFQFSSSPSDPQTAGVRFNSNGTVQKREGASYVQIDASTDWIIPNGDANSTYDVRITNVVWTSGSAFFVEAAAEDVWINLGSNREWSVQDNTGTAAGSKDVSFTVEIRKDGGAVLDSATYSLSAEWEIPF